MKIHAIQTGSVRIKTAQVEGRGSGVPILQISFDVTNGAGPMPSILMRMFGRPQGVLGRLGGVIMARMNADCGAWVSDLLKVGPNDSVLEVGFGPGVVIQRLSQLAAAGHVAGIDPSREMVRSVVPSGSVLVFYGAGVPVYFEPLHKRVVEGDDVGGDVAVVGLDVPDLQPLVT